MYIMTQFANSLIHDFIDFVRDNITVQKPSPIRNDHDIANDNDDVNDVDDDDIIMCAVCVCVCVYKLQLQFH